MIKRNVYSEEFLHRFKMVYAKFGRDSLCLPVLKEEYGSSYPFLTVSNLTRARRLRTAEFEKEREDHVKRFVQLSSKRERDLLINARNFNARTIECLMEVQDKFLLDMVGVNPIDDPSCLQQLNAIVSIQEKINTFAGTGLEDQLRLFKQKLLAQKIADEKTLEELIRLFTVGEGNQFAIETKQGKPKLTFHQEEED